MKITFAKPVVPKSGVVVVTALDGGQLAASAAALDERLGGALGRAAASSRFKGRAGQTVALLQPAGLGIDLLLLVGLGKTSELTGKAAREAGGAIYAALGNGEFPTAAVMVDDLEGCALGVAEMAAEMAYGASLRAYRFEKYRTRSGDDEAETPAKLTTLKFLTEGAARAKKLFADYQPVAEGVFLTRDLVSEPANVIYPETLAARAQALTRLGVKVEVLGEKEMRKLGMGALLGVAQGSAREPKLVVLRWLGLSGAAKAETKTAGKGKAAAKAKAATKTTALPPVAFVGKGVTFDSGGISIKPAAGMEDMKWDMGGAAVVIGLFKALAGRKAAVDAVGVVGLVENMPSGTAQRPGDVVTSLSGQTIEVLNTDAEGRLVLADALHYCIDRFKPTAVIDLATLTGAIMISLGTEKAGLFSNDDALASAIFEAGEAEGEPVWRMPLGKEYDKLLRSDIADMKNIGGRYGGSITAAQFLQRFVGDTPWAHLDIAGVTWSQKPRRLSPKGGTAFGVRLLDRLVRQRFEGRSRQS